MRYVICILIEDNFNIHSYSNTKIRVLSCTGVPLVHKVLENHFFTVAQYWSTVNF